MRVHSVIESYSSELRLLSLVAWCLILAVPSLVLFVLAPYFWFSLPCSAALTVLFFISANEVSCFLLSAAPILLTPLPNARPVAAKYHSNSVAT